MGIGRAGERSGPRTRDLEVVNFKAQPVFRESEAKAKSNAKIKTEMLHTILIGQISSWHDASTVYDITTLVLDRYLSGDPLPFPRRFDYM